MHHEIRSSNRKDHLSGRSARLLTVLIVALSVSCARFPAPAAPGPRPGLTLPADLAASVVILAPGADGYERADIQTAVESPGEGKVSRAIVIRLTRDIAVYRLWSGPDKVENGRTNRIGSWWTHDRPRGNVRQYRTSYEVCAVWNDLTWVATCTLRKGAVVAIGPGNSVSAATCGDKTGKEKYPPNEHNWQLYVSRAFERIGPDKELDCPDPDKDYEAQPGNLAKPKRGPPNTKP